MMSQVRDPLLWAAFDLQSRIFNIVDQFFLRAYFLHGSEEERAYAKRSTVFVFAQYLAWMEIVRRRVASSWLPCPREWRGAARSGHDLGAEHVGGREVEQEVPAGQGG